MDFRNITFIILVKDNVQQSNNLINYLNKLPFKLRIIVADGSKYKQELIFKNLKASKKIYFYSGLDKNILKMYKKIFKALKYVKTKFVFFLDQGDFLNFEILKKCEKILIDDNKKSVAIGNVYNFISKKKKIIIKSKLYKRKPIKETDLIKRLKKNYHLRSYHGLHRTKILNETVKIIIKNDLNDSRSCEFVMDTNNLFFGNFVKINRVYLLHEAPKIKKHIINRKYASREIWFKKYFSKIFKKVLRDLFIFHKIAVNNIVLDEIFKYFLIYDIEYNVKKRRLSFLNRILNKTEIMFKNNKELSKFINIIQT